MGGGAQRMSLGTGFKIGLFWRGGTWESESVERREERERGKKRRRREKKKREPGKWQKEPRGRRGKKVMNLTGLVVRSSQELFTPPHLQVRASNVNMIPYRHSTVCGRPDVSPTGIMTEENKNSLLTRPPTTAQTWLTAPHYRN